MTASVGKNLLALVLFAAAAVLASAWFPSFGALALPLCWPSLFFPGDEATERYGVFYELVLVILYSLPWLWLCSIAVSHCSILISLWNNRKRIIHQPEQG